MKKYFVSLFFLICAIGSFSQISEAEDLKALFVKANEAYRNQDYEHALTDYGQLSEQTHAPEIYYNLGNVAFKMKKIGLAILSYERARKLDPRNSDIVKNLKQAKELVEYRVEDKRGWYVQQLSEFLKYFKWKECLIALLLNYFFLLVVWFVELFSKGKVSFARVKSIVTSVFIILIISASAKFYQTNITKEGVVVKGKVDVRYGPSPNDKLAFNLTEGISFRVEDELDNWYRISLVNGESGWVARDGIEII